MRGEGFGSLLPAPYLDNNHFSCGIPQIEPYPRTPHPVCNVPLGLPPHPSGSSILAGDARSLQPLWGPQPCPIWLPPAPLQATPCTLGFLQTSDLRTRLSKFFVGAHWNKIQFESLVSFKDRKSVV